MRAGAGLPLVLFGLCFIVVPRHAAALEGHVAVQSIGDNAVGAVKHNRSQSLPADEEANVLDFVPEDYRASPVVYPPKDGEEEPTKLDRPSPQALQASVTKSATKKDMVQSLVVDVVNDYVSSGKVFLHSMLKDVVKVMDTAFAASQPKKPLDEPTHPRDERRATQDTADEVLAQVWREESDEKEPAKQKAAKEDNSTKRVVAKRHRAETELVQTGVLGANLAATDALEEEKLGTEPAETTADSSRPSDDPARAALLHELHDAWHDLQTARSEAARTATVVKQEEASPFRNEEMLEEFRTAERSTHDELSRRLSAVRSYSKKLRAQKEASAES